jgi:hypothetical protein
MQEPPKCRMIQHLGSELQGAAHKNTVLLGTRYLVSQVAANVLAASLPLFPDQKLANPHSIAMS